MMVNRKLHFAQLVIACVRRVLYLKWLDFRWPKDPLVNLLVAVMSLFFIITNGNNFNNETVINTPIFPAPIMADMGPYPGVPGYSSFVAAIAMPGDGAVFVAPADITIFGTVASNISSVVRLDFYADGALLYSNRYANYAYTWKGVPAGSIP